MVLSCRETPRLAPRRQGDHSSWDTENEWKPTPLKRATSFKAAVLLLARGRDQRDSEKVSRAQTLSSFQSQLPVPFAVCQLGGRRMGSAVRQT